MLARSLLKTALKMRLLLIIGVICYLQSSCMAMERWPALSMLESGDDDHMVGQAGEISRYQIRSELWPGGDAQDSKVALTAAQRIMQSRLDVFRRSHKREASDFEFYVLWNAPAQVDHPIAAVAERAQRFVNLTQR